MICNACGTENRAGRKFCSECAAALSMACPACGSPNEPTEKFCGECAASLGTGATAGSVRPGPTQGSPVAAGTAPAPTAERRLVSVLFADLVGFTPFAEERDAEEVRDTLNSYFEIASEVITRYGGNVEKFIGDAVMAVWGAPVARENDAERSVRAALELIDAVRSLGNGIQARAGVLTGEAAVTLGATNQGMVAGDLVNTAARLQSVAQPGTVLVGEPTMRAASGAIAFEEAGDQVLKGKASPVPAWRALRVVAEVGGRGRTETLEAPFVGRDDELRLLKDLFHATGREGKGRLVSIIGPAGIGKSRLSWEFLKYIDGVLERVWWHTGRSPAYGEGITFWALGEMIRRRAGLVETDNEPTTRAKIAETLATHVPDEAERRWIEPALLTLLGFETRGPGESEQLFGAWRTFFERMAATGTVALVFEDLHWADSGTLDFIDHLLEWSRTYPIYVVTLARPELLEKRSDWGAGKRNFSSIYLEPLSDPSMRALLAGLVPGLPEPAIASIVGRADGIPLYAVETVRMLLAEGKLALEGDRYVPVGDLADLAVPETLTALIASRLDALAIADRALIADAAVLGHSFTLAGLAAVSGVSEDELRPRLRALVRRELLVSETDPRSPELGQYAFVQALIREVAYNTLAKKDRKNRHLAAARFFEAVGSDEMAGALATHYLAAHANATAAGEAEALAGQARIALKAAADRAISLGAHDQAVAFLQQAVKVTTDPKEEAWLLGRAGESAFAAAHYELAATLMERAVGVRRAIGDPPTIAAAIAELGRVLENGRVEEALALLEPASAEFADLYPDPGVLALESQHASALQVVSQDARAIAIADRVLEAAEHADLPAVVARTLVVKGSALGNLGRLREAIGVIRAGEDLAREVGQHSTVLGALITRGFYLGEVDTASAVQAYSEGLGLARRLGQRRQALTFANNLGFTAFLAGDWDRALAVLGDALEGELERVNRVSLLANYIIVVAHRGDPVAHLVRQMEDLKGDDTDVAYEVSAADALGNVALAAGALDEARAEWLRLAGLASAYMVMGTYQAAHAAIWQGDLAGVVRDLEAIDATGYHGNVVETRRITLQAAIAGMQGAPAEALNAYREALRRWHDLGMQWDEALTGLDIAHVLVPSDREVRATIQATRELLASLGAAPLIARLDALAGRRPNPAAAAGERSDREPLAGHTSTGVSPASD